METEKRSTMVERVFDLQQVICLADAAYVEKNINTTDEARRQLVSADVVLLNKCDQVSSSEVEQLVQTLNGIHPTATIFQGEHGVFPIDKVFEVKPFHDERTTQIAPVIPNGTHRHNDIKTFTLTFDRPFRLDTLARDLVQLARFHRDQVYRIKGIIAVNTTPTRVVIQSVRDSFVLTDGPPWASESERISHIVFIGKNMNRAEIEKWLGSHLIR